MASLKDLLAQRAALEQQIAETQERERADAIAKVKSLMSEYGLNVADLTARSTKTAGAKASKVAAKYRNQATGESWSGRGLQPKWLKAAIANGAKLEDFAL
ncbi:H-NS histone family protein [Roseateles depolymerans]|uniref:Nucleoid protein H-NS n=1 Tax=Roseateles depolymerans TaxID=76731 RepID=A0A0U3NC57_9BURK|nr:H-NS histone family protein [Roseateles depolymerans]ALV06064.1 Nucleoid protein H-NS [Roseateles depolymerans]REG11960.1 DNA-binding protein H-NS [Roseateles depolymerans]